MIASFFVGRSIALGRAIEKKRREKDGGIHYYDIISNYGIVHGCINYITIIAVGSLIEKKQREKDGGTNYYGIISK